MTSVVCGKQIKKYAIFNNRRFAQIIIGRSNSFVHYVQEKQSSEQGISKSQKYQFQLHIFMYMQYMTFGT